MGKTGSFKISGLTELQKSLNSLGKTSDQFMEACAKDLAARLLAMVKRRTPVGHYSREVEVMAKRDSKYHKKGDVYKKRVNTSGKKGGTLRRGWTVGEIRKEGNVYKIDITNPVEYAPYVEYGHRTTNHRGWVKGHFMMTISEQELQTIAPRVLERRIQKFLGGVK